MAADERSRTVLILLCILPIALGQEYQIPDVTILALSPRGIRISIPDNPRMNLFAFQGRINRQIGDDDVGDISAEVMRASNGHWTYEDDGVSLKVGDTIYYYALVIRNKKEHRIKRSFTVTELIDPNKPMEPAATATSPAPIVPISVAPSESGTCRPTATIVSQTSGVTKTVCSGDIIFEDDFDAIRKDLWTYEQFIPSKPEYPFVSYRTITTGQTSDVPTVHLSNGTLKIDPKLQETLPNFDKFSILSGKLDLTNGCTQVGSCEFTSDGGQILPPIASGRVTSKMSFKYAFIEIKAKVPQGDWLYPDILLEPVSKKYGADNYASGIIRIAGVLGNWELKKGREEYGNRVLYGGPIMDFKCRNELLSKKMSGNEWGNDFHVYSLRWAPDLIALFVDGEEWGRTEPPASGLQALLPRSSCNPPRMFLQTPIAPFDEFFRIALGVSAGGISEFPDDVISRYNPKPWVNSARRARLNFYNAKDSWLGSWTRPALELDYVRVRAL